MAVKLHDNASLYNSVKLENKLFMYGYKQDISKFGFFPETACYSKRHRSILDLMTCEQFESDTYHPVFADLTGIPETDDMVDLIEYEASEVHPAAIGYSFMEVVPASSKLEGSPGDMEPISFLENSVLGLLAEAMEAMLYEAKLHHCFIRPRTAFDSLDFIVEYLYKHNPIIGDSSQRHNLSFCDIPFVKEHWHLHPRPPLAKSLVWSNSEAAVVIQAFWRGYRTRRIVEVQELRQWQRQWREINGDVRVKVHRFWQDCDEASSRLSSSRRSEEAAPAEVAEDAKQESQS